MLELHITEKAIAEYTEYIRDNLEGAKRAALDGIASDTELAAEIIVSVLLDEATVFQTDPEHPEKPRRMLLGEAKSRLVSSPAAVERPTLEELWGLYHYASIVITDPGTPYRVLGALSYGPCIVDADGLVIGTMSYRAYGPGGTIGYCEVKDFEYNAKTDTLTVRLDDLVDTYGVQPLFWACVNKLPR